jgi:hypothetical protein
LLIGSGIEVGLPEPGEEDFHEINDTNFVISLQEFLCYEF